LWTAVGVLGFSSGLPLLLTGSTLQAWLKDARVDMGLIGASALLGLPYNVKFLWSPLLDAFPALGLGRRRGWMVLSQGVIAALLVAMSWQDPRLSLGGIALIAVAIAFASASQDIAFDAFRTESLAREDQGLGAAISINAYRIAMLVAGAFALWLADQVPWRIVYLVMAGFMLPGICTSLLVSEPVAAAAPRNLVDAVVKPFQVFFRKRGALEILAFTLLYKLGDMMASALTTVFLMDQGFSKGEIGLATKGVGLGSLIVGALAGGILMRRWDLRRALLVFGILQALSILAPFALSLVGFNRPMMYGTLVAENLCFGTGTVAYTAFLMRACTKGMAATQYALLSSLMALPRTLFASSSGLLVSAVGWPPYFLLCIALALPGLLLLLRYPRWDLEAS
jgi:MFS transporter, PAT family, beta-lactamase induction signal transducer AmpG